MTNAIVVRCPEHLATVRAFAASAGLSGALERVLDYVKNYGNSTPTRVELFADTAFGSRCNFTAEISLAAGADNAHWLTMGIVYDEARKAWGTHT